MPDAHEDEEAERSLGEEDRFHRFSGAVLDVEEVGGEEEEEEEGSVVREAD